MDAPLVLHRHYGGSVDHTGAPPWHPRFEAYIGRMLPAAVASARERQRHWWEAPGVQDWLSAQPTRFNRQAVTIVLAYRRGAVPESLATTHHRSVAWIRKWADRIELAVQGEFLTGRYE